MGLLWFVIIGAIAGWLAGQFMKGNGFGLLGDIIVGVIGAFIGRYLFHAVGMQLGGGLVASLIVAFIGALVLLFVVRLFTGRSSGRRLWS
ncbi:MAG TPA: GlsB/YeaQ/YmgE family stress response membrane protein [Thermoanaerobaculia bacterium]|nr:GlsB/YeaQ/YmgE family stress response membrane protein [Thermoanaerobaculia bacterium]